MKFFFYISAFFLALGANAQSIELTAFSVDQNQNGVFILWTLGKGSLCEGSIVHRSTDSTNQDSILPIHQVYGICGDQNFESTYTYLDEEPHSGWNYYQVKLGDNFYSEWIGIYVHDYSGKGYLAGPNPATDAMNIEFPNFNNDFFDFTIFNAFGQIVETKSINSSNIRLNTSQYESGTYLFQIMNNEQKIIGKFIVI